MDNYITGKIIRIIYESPTTLYKVGIFKVKETDIEELNEYVNKVISFTGSFTELNSDLEYTFHGSLVNHPKYGVQFNTLTYEVVEPKTTDSIVAYLSSGIFKGIGLKTAKKIVEKFGTETIDIIKNNYESLASINGMTYTKAKRMHDKIADNELNQEYVIKLSSMGFTINEAINLMTLYKSRLFEIVDNNIYELVKYVRFDKLDTIYLKNNNEDTKIRIEALIKHNIYEMCYEKGDTLISKEELLIEMKKSFKGIFTVETFMLHINDLIKNKELVEVNGMLALYNFYSSENLIIDNIKRLNNIKNIHNIDKINHFIKEYETRNNILLADNQKNAIRESILNNFYIITGGPGTGKTTIVKAIFEVLKDAEDIKEEDIVLLAPTGRSAKRLSESVVFPASTIHRYLKWNKETGEFQVNENNKTTHKIVIVDEASMLDIFLFSSLLKGLRLNVKLILVGDANQLPSIAPGDILNDLLKLDFIKKTYLNEIYRVKEGRYITYLANDIRNKRIFEKIDNYDDFKFINCKEEEILPYLTEVCNKVKEKDMDIDKFEVLCPMYKGYNGIDNINKVMSEIFNPNKKKYIINDKYYSVGDKVIQLTNDIDNDVYNGDIGYIEDIRYEDKKLVVTIDYGRCEVEYKSGELDKFNLAYSVSIHKSQGSEYDNVVVILSKGFSRMLYNKLIYTAITRAKKSLILIGSIETFNKGVQTTYAENRRTYLKCINTK